MDLLDEGIGPVFRLVRLAVFTGHDDVFRTPRPRFDAV